MHICCGCVARSVYGAQSCIRSSILRVRVRCSKNIQAGWHAMTSYSKVAKKYGVTKAAVFLWCKKYQMPADEYRPSRWQRGKDKDPKSCNQVSIKLNTDNTVVARMCKKHGLSLDDFARYKIRARQLHTTIPHLLAHCREYSVEPEDVEISPGFIKRVIAPSIKKRVSCQKVANEIGISRQRVSQICVKRGITPSQLLSEHREKSEL